jgi:hypothetical protein
VGVSIEPLETQLHSFIVKVWSEATDEKTVSWRGNITHVPSGRRLYITDVNEICGFIEDYLTEMGVNLRHGVQRWFRK